MDERSRALLKTLIERYIEEWQSVYWLAHLFQIFGFRHLISAATIRNVMANLEKMGL